MLEFDPTTGTITNDSKAMEGYGDPTMGYQFGSVNPFYYAGNSYDGNYGKKLNII